jgi:hypothetical protein
VGGDSERHQLPVSLSRAVLALVVVACVVAIAAGVLSGRRAPVVEVSDGSPVVETSDGSPSVSVTMTGSSGDAKSSEDKGTSAGEGEPGGEAFESSGLSGVPEEAAVLVREYEGRDDCVLVRSGYLDLSALSKARTMGLSRPRSCTWTSRSGRRRLPPSDLVAR